MRKNFILLLLLLLFFLVLGGYFLIRTSNNESVILKADIAPVENFIAQSAKEVQDPQAGNSNYKDAKIDTHGTLADICRDANNFACYQAHYENLVKNKSIQAAFADLRIRYKQDMYVVAQCHPLTHVIGNEAVEKFNSVGEAYTQGDSFCWSGYYHGVMEKIVFKIGGENLLSKINDICADIQSKTSYSFDYYNCVHGLGHGIMALNNNELFDSLKQCDSLSGDWEKSACHGGVFMENIIVDNKDHFTKYLKAGDPVYPCNAVDQAYKNVCYLMQTSYMLKVTGGDFAKVFSICEQADAGYSNICYQSLGRDASGRTTSDYFRTKDICGLGKNFDQRSNCIIGAVKDFISYFHSDQQAKFFCNSLSAELQQLCTDTAIAYYASF